MITGRINQVPPTSERICGEPQNVFTGRWMKWFLSLHFGKTPNEPPYSGTIGKNSQSVATVCLSSATVSKTFDSYYASIRNRTEETDL